MLLLGYARYPVPGFGSYLRFVLGLDEHDIQLNLKQYNSNFIIFERPPGIYSFEDISYVVHTMGDHQATLGIRKWW